jgi:hypothetical protein
MPFLKKSAIAIGAVILIAVVWYRLAYPNYTFHYRLTVQAEVDGELREASGVIGIYWEQMPAPLPDMIGFKLAAFGQSVLLDLGEYGSILVPLGANTRLAAGVPMRFRSGRF